MARNVRSEPIVAAQSDPAERVADPALVVVDMQNDFVRAGAPLEVPDARTTIAAQQRLLETFRARGLPVVFTRFLSYESDCLMWLWSPECHPATRACWPGHTRSYDDVEGPLECIAVVDELAPAEALAAGRAAKAYCARAARTVCETAVQVHGGMGNTWDCIVHVYLRRALLSTQWFGDDGEQLRRLQWTRLGVADGPA